MGDTAFLAIDVSNSEIVLGVYERRVLRHHWRLQTDSGRTADEYGVLVRSLLGGVDHAPIRGVAVSSVVPPMAPVVDLLCRQYLGVTPLVVGPGVRTGMPILYDKPQEVGADRIVNAIAAYERTRRTTIIVDFSTATTFAYVSEKGEYVGGVIAPGLGISAEALFSRAARLARVEGREPARGIGRTTQESIQSGLFDGSVALVEGLVRRVREELGVAAPVVATGGIAPVFRESLSFLDAIDPGLTLEGLRLIWEKNRR